MEKVGLDETVGLRKRSGRLFNKPLTKKCLSHIGTNYKFLLHELQL